LTNVQERVILDRHAASKDCPDGLNLLIWYGATVSLVSDEINDANRTEDTYAIAGKIVDAHKSITRKQGKLYSRPTVAPLANGRNQRQENRDSMSI
jgi:hypothetical protein